MRTGEGRQCVACNVEDTYQLPVDSGRMTIRTLQYYWFRNICDCSVAQCNNGVLNSHKHGDGEGVFFGGGVLLGGEFYISFLILRYSNNIPCDPVQWGTAYPLP